jgi:hypothetical protein
VSRPGRAPDDDDDDRGAPPARARGARSVNPGRVALLACLAVAAAAGALTLTRSPLRVVRTSAKPETTLTSTTGKLTVCQADETLPRGVSAIRLGMEASFGPMVSLKAYSGDRVIAQGSRAADWTSASVTIPVKPIARTVSPVKICVHVPQNGEFLQVYGAAATQGGASSGRKPPAKLNIEYLTPAQGSWWSRVSAVARHIGVGHAITGTWVAVLVAALVATVAALTIGLAWTELP